MAQYYFNLGEELGAAYAAAGFPSRGFISTEYLSLETSDSSTRTAGVVSLSSDGISINRGNEVDPSNGLDSGFIRSPNITFTAEPTGDFELYCAVRVYTFSAQSNFNNSGINVFYRLANALDSQNVNLLANCINIALGGNSNGLANNFYYDTNGIRQNATNSGNDTVGALGLLANINSIVRTRYRVVGNRIRRKQWLNDTTEPAEWDVDFTLDSLPSTINETGFIALNIPISTLSVTILNMAIGTEGDDAPTTPVVNPPTANTRIVSGTVTLDGQPYESDITVTSVGDNPVVLANGRSNPDGTYNINVGSYNGAVTVHTLQDYGQAWSPSLVLEINDVIHPTVPNGYVFRVVSTGSTGLDEPAWPATPSVQVTDGGVTYMSEILLKPEIQGYIQTTQI